MTRRFFLVLLTVLLASCDSEPEARNGNKQMQISLLEFAGESVSIPIRFLHDRPIVDVKINGKGPFALVLDTGASSIALEREVAKHLELPDCGTSTHRGLSSEEYEARMIGVERFEVGVAVLENVGVSEIDFFLKQGMSGIHGVWGMCHFGKRIVIIDLLGKVLHIRRQQAESVGGVPWLPLKVHAHTPEVPIQIGGKSHQFLIDTGSDQSLSVAASLVQELPCYEERFQNMICGVGNVGIFSMRTTSTRLRQDIVLGNHSIKQPYVAWSENRRGRNGMGMEILRNFVIEIDLKENRVRFLRDEASPVSFPDRKRLGVSIGYNSEDNSPVITEIYPYRTGMNDVKVGDRVLAIDGHPSSDINGILIQELIKTKKTLVFTVERHGKRLTFDVEVHQDSFAVSPAL